MTLVLSIIAVLLAVWGVIALLDGAILWGILLLLLAAAVGPGGYSWYGRTRP